MPLVRVPSLKPLELPVSSTNVFFIPEPELPHEVDLGSILFRRVTQVPTQIKLASHPETDQDFPSAEGWVHTWIYTGEDAPGASVITHPKYYQGAMGVIVDDHGNVLTPNPVIQIAGSRRGRRRAITGGPEFLKVDILQNSWALRYGGERNGAHRFTIVDFVNDRERDVVQDFRVPFDEAAQGFSVKGVVVRIHSFGHGKIRYSFQADQTHQ